MTRRIIRRNVLKSRIANRRKRAEAHTALMASLRPLLLKYGDIWGHGSELARAVAWAEHRQPHTVIAVVV